MGFLHGNFHKQYEVNHVFQKGCQGFQEVSGRKQFQSCDVCPNTQIYDRVDQGALDEERPYVMPTWKLPHIYRVSPIQLITSI